MLRERFFITLFLSLPILILAGIFKPIPTDPVQKSEIISRHFWALKTNGTQKYDVVVLGDSRVYRGISPSAMQSILKGYRILNFGYSNGGLTHEMFEEADRRLDIANRKPVIILGVTPVSLTQVAAKNDLLHQEKGRTRDYIFNYLYLYRFMDFFQPFTPQMILDSIGGQGKPSQQGYFQEFHDDGWVASWLIPEDTKKAIETYRDFFSKTKVSQDILDGVMQQTRQWAEQGIKVFAFRPPTTVEMVALEDETSGFDQAAFEDQFTKAGGTWLEVPPYKYHTYDGSHLVKSSAIEFSVDLARLIEETLVTSP